PEAHQSPHTASLSTSLPPATTETIPTSTPSEIPTLRQYSRRVRIAQSSTLPIAAYEPASPLGDVSQGEACPTVSGLEEGQDRENIIKTSTLPHDSTPKQTEMVTKVAAQDLEISNLKARIKFLEDKDGGRAEPSGENATIKGRGLETGEEAGVERSTEKGMVSVPPAAKVSTVGIPTGSGMVPTASPIFTIASVVTPYSRRKGKEKMVESDTPKKKKLQKQIDVQVAREMEEQMVREDQRRNEQIERDAEIARIHAEEELREDRVDQWTSKISRPSFKVRKVPSSTKQATLQEATNRILHISAQKSFGLENKAFQGLKTLCPWLLKKKEKDLREMDSVLVEEVYVEALQVKHPIINWEIHSEGQRNYWKIIRLGGSTAKELWVELKRLFELDVKDQLWTHTQALMHDPVEWRLYDSCGVHHVLTGEGTMGGAEK
nr:hypothetical protein [Tanacetum cinerariifolium]